MPHDPSGPPLGCEALHQLNIAFNGTTGMTAAGIAERIRTNPGESVWIAEADGTPVDFCCLRIDRSFCYVDPITEITELYIAPPHRRRGLARALLRSVLGCARTQYRAAEVRVLTGSDNRAAHALYAPVGFVPDDEPLFRIAFV